jgi:hypothetical protein
MRIEFKKAVLPDDLRSLVSFSRKLFPRIVFQLRNRNEIADYSRVIDQLPVAPVEQVARALGNGGGDHYERGMYAAFLGDTEAALEKLPTLDHVAFSLGLALLASLRT